MIDPTQNPTVQTPSVPGGPPPAMPPIPPTGGAQTFEDYVNGMLSQKLATAIVKKQKMQYSILHVGQFHDGWWICEVENISGSNVSGDDLLIVIAKTTPIMLYPSGAVSPPPFTVQ